MPEDICPHNLPDDFDFATSRGERESFYGEDESGLASEQEPSCSVTLVDTLESNLATRYENQLNQPQPWQSFRYATWQSKLTLEKELGY